MDPNLEKKDQDLVDRQEIREVVVKYCRGMDREDRELALSAFHPDAIADYGNAVMHTSEFVDWANDFHRTMFKWQTIHTTTVTIDLDGDTAHVESYHIGMCEARTGPSMISVGRYLDRMEKRNGRWAIATRVSIGESFFKIEVADIPEEFLKVVHSNGPFERSKKDRSYDRPLEVKRPVRKASSKMEI